MTTKLLFCLFLFVIGVTLATGVSGQTGDRGMHEVKKPAQSVPSPSQNVSAVSWDSPRLREVDRKLNSMGFEKIDARDRSEDEQRALVGILDHGFSRDELHQLASSFSTLPVDPKHWGNSETKLVSATIESFLRSGDRDGLVLVLSLRCPRFVGWTDIEHFVALFGKDCKDPITVFGKAYAKCKVPETRQAKAAAVRRAFGPSGVLGKDDREFVENAMRWYEANKGHLEVDWRYRNRAVASVSADSPDGERDSLFVSRNRDSARPPSK